MGAYSSSSSQCVEDTLNNNLEAMAMAVSRGQITEEVDKYGYFPATAATATSESTLARIEAKDWNPFDCGSNAGGWYWADALLPTNELCQGRPRAGNAGRKTRC